MHPRTILHFIVISLFSLVIFSCGSSTPVVTGPDVEVFVKPGVVFSKDASITVLRKGTHSTNILGNRTDEDVMGAGGIITNELIKEGFNIISASLAREAIKFHKESRGSDPENSEMSAELYMVKELNSVYSLEFEGAGNLDVIRLPKHYDFTSFSAVLTDLNTGEIIASGSFVGNAPVDYVCTQFVEQLVSKLQLKD